MTLANKNKILWLELQWCLIIAAEADECLAGHAKNMWNSQSQETVGQSEPMTASAVRVKASLVYDCEQYLWGVEGRAGNQSAPSWSHQQNQGRPCCHAINILDSDSGAHTYRCVLRAQRKVPYPFPECSDICSYGEQVPSCVRNTNQSSTNSGQWPEK